MRQKLTGCVMLFFLIVAIPVVITLVFGKEASLPVSGDGETLDEVIGVGEGQTIDLQEYLIGVTAAQLPGDYRLEAVKAQMILNRTYFYRVLGDRKELSASELELSYLTKAERIARWSAEGYTQAEEIFDRAAAETEGQVMTCQRALAVGMSHPVSAGRTRDLSGTYPYLRSVDSTWDSRSDGYVTVIEYSSQELLKKLDAIEDAGLPEGALKIGLQILEKDEGGYVKRLMIGTGIVTGDELAETLGLPSCAFSFQWPEKDRLSIVCFGRGHGYGMSRYGADQLAREGKTAQQILQYYFQNIAVETWKRDE